MATATLLAATVLSSTAAPAVAVDADRRTGPEHHQRHGPPGLLLLADLRPDLHCLRVRTVPVSTSRDLLYIPCQDEPVLPPTKPWGEQPPVVIPVQPQR